MKTNYKNYHRDFEYSENEQLFKNIFEKRFNLLTKYVSKGRVLDIGASNGVMLDIFKQNGWDTYGVEPSKNSSIAAKKGHKINSTFFEKSKFKRGFFDAVILNHTLEHMENPDQVLIKIYELIKKGGYLLVDVPNSGGLSSVLMGKHWPYRLPNEHISQFTKKILSEIFRKSGFKIIHFESRSGVFEYARPFSELLYSLVNLKKRFLFNLLTFPFDLISTILNMGDSMSIVGKKI